MQMFTKTLILLIVAFHLVLALPVYAASECSFYKYNIKFKKKVVGTKTFVVFDHFTEEGYTREVYTDLKASFRVIGQQVLDFSSYGVYRQNRLLFYIGAHMRNGETTPFYYDALASPNTVFKGDTPLPIPSGGLVTLQPIANTLSAKNSLLGYFGKVDSIDVKNRKNVILEYDNGEERTSRLNFKAGGRYKLFYRNDGTLVFGQLSKGLFPRVEFTLVEFYSTTKEKGEEGRYNQQMGVCRFYRDGLLTGPILAGTPLTGLTPE